MTKTVKKIEEFEELTIQSKRWELEKIIIVSIIPILMAIGGLLLDLKANQSVAMESQNTELKMNAEKFNEMKEIKKSIDTVLKRYDNLDKRVKDLEDILINEKKNGKIYK